MSGDINTVLADASGGGTTWDLAKWYNANDASDPWKTYNPAYPTLTDMPTITNSMGVWLHLTASDGILTTGVSGAYSAGPVVITLYAGWNLVGYPSATPMAADASLFGTGADWIAVYDAAAPFVQDYDDLSLVTMSEGNAYWVHVPATTAWTVGP